MQDLQDPATAGNAPLSAGSSWLIRLERHLRGVHMPPAEKLTLFTLAGHANAEGVSFPSQEALARETGLGLTKLGDALRELADRHWFTRSRKIHSGKVWASTTYFLAIGDGWPVEKRPPKGGGKRQPSGACEPLEEVSGTENVNRTANPRLVSGTENDLRLTPTKLPSEKLPEEAPRREAPIAPARTRVQGLQPGLPGLLEAAATPPRDSAPPKRAKKPKPPPAVRAIDQYAAAYLAGHAAAGGTLAALTASEKATLGRAAAAHAVYQDGSPIVADALVHWIRQRAKDFRRAVDEPARHKGGYSTFGFLTWLNNGHDGEERPFAPGTEPPPPEPYRIPRTPPKNVSAEDLARGMALLDEVFPACRAARERA